MTYNIGVIIGPILGGLLSDLAGAYPGLFGHVEFFKRYPYAAPNLLSAFFLFSAMISTWLCLDETLDTRLGKRDVGRELGRKLWQCLTRSNRSDASYARPGLVAVSGLPPFLFFCSVRSSFSLLLPLFLGHVPVSRLA